MNLPNPGIHVICSIQNTDNIIEKHISNWRTKLVLGSLHIGILDLFQNLDLSRSESNRPDSRLVRLKIWPKKGNVT